MLFQSYGFIFAFLPVTLIVFYFLLFNASQRIVIGWLVVASCFFYAWYVPAYLALLAVSIAVNYSLAVRLADTRSKAVLVLGIVLNLGALAYFKYAGLLLESIQALTRHDLPVPEIILPIAISFFTFQQIAYLVDIQRGGEAHRSPLVYTLFVVFFPQLIAGPIVHHVEVTPQFARLSPKTSRVAVNLSIGLTIFTLGLFKKLAIADSLSVYADLVFDAAAAGRTPGLIECWNGYIEVIESGSSGFVHNCHLNPHALEGLATFVDEMEQAGSRVVLIVSPILPALIDAMAAKGDVYGYVDRLWRVLGKTYADFYNFLDPRELGSPPCEFLDEIHGGEVTHMRILRRIARDPESALHGLVDTALLDKLIAANAGHMVVAHNALGQAYERYLAAQGEGECGAA